VIYSPTGHSRKIKCELHLLASLCYTEFDVGISPQILRFNLIFFFVFISFILILTTFDVIKSRAVQM
jgi:hypothetical protein